MNILTFDGTPSLRHKCRKIKGEYYEINKQCFFVAGKWYRINSGLIDKNWETGEWFLLSSSKEDLIYGITNYDGSRPVFGFFSPNPYKNVLVRVGASIKMCISEDAVREFYYSNGIFSREPFIHKLNPQLVFDYDPPYRGKDVPYEFSRLVYTPDIDSTFSRKYKEFLSPLGNYTWGFELETMGGLLTKKDCLLGGLLPVRDGSVSGSEYVTSVIKSPEHWQRLRDGLNSLIKRDTFIDHMCSTHMHVGGYPRTEEAIMNLYNNMITLEPAFYKMFPVHYKKTGVFKRRDYNVPLPRGFHNTHELFEYLATTSSIKYGFYESHPADPRNDRKWEIRTRYHWMSFVPFYFSMANTVELRVHTPTFNFDKLLLWALIINAVFEFSKKKVIVKETLPDLIDLAYNKHLAEVLKRYIILRTNWFAARDAIGVKEVYLDNKFSIDGIERSIKTNPNYKLRRYKRKPLIDIMLKKNSIAELERRVSNRHSDISEEPDFDALLRPVTPQEVQSVSLNDFTGAVWTSTTASMNTYFSQTDPIDNTRG